MSLFEYSLFWACLAFFSLVQTSLLMHKRSLQWPTIWWALRWKRVSSKGLCSLISITISVTIGLFVLTVLTGVNPERLEKHGYSLAKSRESCHVSAEKQNKSKPTDGYETSLKMSLKISNYRLGFIIMDFLFGICLIEPTESVSTQPISRKSRRAVSCFVIMISLKIRSHSVNFAGRSAPQAHWTTKVEKKKERSRAIYEHWISWRYYYYYYERSGFAVHWPPRDGSKIGSAPQLGGRGWRELKQTNETITTKRHSIHSVTELGWQAQIPMVLIIFMGFSIYSSSLWPVVIVP